MSVTLALPSKGRMKEDVLALFARAGLTVELPADSRSYRGRMPALPELDIAFLSASEIARELHAGTVALGVTGLDLALEGAREAGESLEPVLPLGFGRADVVVAIPDAWVDVRAMADLDDVAAGFRQRHGRRLRIATKYWRLTQGHFADHGVAVYRIVESLGATEGAPASGQADLIVDITTTGSTLRANQLRVLDDGVILRSEATLLASRRAGPPAAVTERLLAALGPVLGAAAS